MLRAGAVDAEGSALTADVDLAAVKRQYTSNVTSG